MAIERQKFKIAASMEELLYNKVKLYFEIQFEKQTGQQ